MNTNLLNVFLDNEVINDACETIVKILNTNQNIEDLKACFATATVEICEELFEDSIDYNTSFEIFAGLLKSHFDVEVSTTFNWGEQRFEIDGYDTPISFSIASVEELDLLTSHFETLVEKFNITQD